MRRLCASLLAMTASVVGLAALTTAPAHAGDQRPCVSQAEYRNVLTARHNAWSMAKVQDHFDTPGRWITEYRDAEGTDVVREYTKCAGWARDSGTRYVGLWFDNYTHWDYRFRVYRKNPNTAWAFPSWLY